MLLSHNYNYHLHPYNIWNFRPHPDNTQLKRVVRLLGSIFHYVSHWYNGTCFYEQRGNICRGSNINVWKSDALKTYRAFAGLFFTAYHSWRIEPSYFILRWKLARKFCHRIFWPWYWSCMAPAGMCRKYHGRNPRSSNEGICRKHCECSVRRYG